MRERIQNIDLKPRPHIIRYAHQAFLSLNLGLILKLAMSQQSRFTWESTIWPKFNAYFQLHPHDPTGYWIAFFTMALALSLAIFLLLHALLHLFEAEEAILSVVGISSLFALPIMWLYQSYYKSSVPSLPHPPGVLLFVELAATAACSVAYLNQLWPPSTWMIGLALVIHFSFWAWLFLGGVYFWRAPAQSVFPIVSMCSASAWVLYIKYKTRRSIASFAGPTG